MTTQKLPKGGNFPCSIPCPQLSVIDLVIRVDWVVFIKIQWIKRKWFVRDYYLYESVDLIVGEVQSGEVVDPREDHHLEDLELVVAEIQLNDARLPV